MKLSTLAPSAMAAASIAQAQTVQWNIEKRSDAPAGLRRRDGKSVLETISNEKGQGGYFASVKIGTPGQDFNLQLDTGSSDVWVPSSSADICTQVSSKNPGCVLGSFNADKSSTLEDTGKVFKIKYQDESGALGTYVEDVFEIGGASVKNLTMGLANDTDIAYGLVGVGYAVNEAGAGLTGASTYPNLPIALKDAGLINTVAYSLWLNDLSANKGSVLFGGIDTEKYVGDLTKLSITKDPESEQYTHFLVGLTTLHAVSPSGTDLLTSVEEDIQVVLDSGTTLSYLPTDMAQQVWTEVGAVYDSDVKSALIPCTWANHKGYFSFGFGGPGGPRINVTMDELVMSATVSGPAPKFISGPYKGQEVCEFGIQAQDGSPYLLGDTFLRSAYVVYDLSNNEIGIAATDFNSTKSNVVPFASNSAPIPSATAAPSQNATLPTSTSTPTAGASQAAASGFQTKSSSGGSGAASISARTYTGSALSAVGLSVAFFIGTLLL